MEEIRQVHVLPVLLFLLLLQHHLDPRLLLPSPGGQGTGVLGVGWWVGRSEVEDLRTASCGDGETESREARAFS